jgi:hypothetical protein
MNNISQINTSLSRRPFLQGRQPWVRLLIIAGMLILSFYLTFGANSNKLIFTLFIFLAVFVGWLFLRWPGLGLIAAVVSGMLVPDFLPKDINVPMVIVAGLLGLWILDMVVGQRKITLVASRTLLPAIVLIVVALFSFGVGQFPWFNFVRNAPVDAQLGGLALFILSAGAFLLASNQIKDLRWLKWIVWIFLLFGGLYIVASAIPGLGIIRKVLFQPGSFGGVFYAWLPALAFSQAAFNRELRPGWRILLGCLVVVSLFYSFVQNYDWKSGWMPSFASVIAIVWLRNWRAGLLLVLLSFIPAWRLVPDLLASDDYSISTRFDAWLIMYEIVKINPILGLGFANYYWYTPLFRIRGYAVTFNSHNNYVDIVAQTGLAGLACFLWLFWEVFWIGFRLRGRVREGFEQAYVYGALGGLAGTLVAAMLGDWLLPFVYNVGLSGFRTGVLAWLFLGGLVVIENLTKESMLKMESAV